MIWIMLVYGAFLFFLAYERKRIISQSSFRVAWISYAVIPFTHAFFTLFRAGNSRSPQGLALVTIWEDGISWLLLGISLVALLNALIPAASSPSSGSLLSDQIDQLEKDKGKTEQEDSNRPAGAVD